MRVDAERNRQRIMEAAVEVFIEHGAHAPSDAVARRAGVGVGTLYRHFPSREDLLAALLAGWIEEVDAKCTAVIAEVDCPRARLLGWLQGYVEFLRVHKRCTVPLTTDIGDLSSPLRPKWETLLAATNRVVASLPPADRIEVDAMSLNRLAGSVAVVANLGDMPQVEVDALLRHIVGGLVPSIESSAGVSVQTV